MIGQPPEFRRLRAPLPASRITSLKLAVRPLAAGLQWSMPESDSAVRASAIFERHRPWTLQRPPPSSVPTVPKLSLFEPSLVAQGGHRRTFISCSKRMSATRHFETCRSTRLGLRLGVWVAPASSRHSAHWCIASSTIVGQPSLARVRGGAGQCVHTLRVL